MRGLTAALLACLIAACGMFASHGDGVAPAEEGPRTALVWRSLDRTYGGCRSDRSAAAPACPAVHLRYPEVTLPGGVEASRRVQDWIEGILMRAADRQGPARTLEEAADGFFAAFAASEGGAAAPPWSLDAEVSILLDTPRVLSLAVDVSQYRGGAHGTEERWLASFSPETGRRIGLADLVGPGNEERLAAVAETWFRAAVDLPPAVSLADGGYWFEGGVFRLNANFALGPGGLVVRYNSYEIAPYERGPTDMVVPWAALRPLAAPGGVLDEGDEDDEDDEDG